MSVGPFKPGRPVHHDSCPCLHVGRLLEQALCGIAFENNSDASTSEQLCLLIGGNRFSSVNLRCCTGYWFSSGFRSNCWLPSLFCFFFKAIFKAHHELTLAGLCFLPLLGLSHVAFKGGPVVRPKPREETVRSSRVQSFICLQLTESCQAKAIAL